MPELSAADTAWVLVAAALVLFMTPGLAFFYGGLVRGKNVLGTIMQSFMAMALVSVVWMVIGHSLAFGPDKGLVIGALDYVGWHNVGATAHALAPTIPHSTFAVYQMMFAIITPALISGAITERVKFSAYAVFITVWVIVCYAPVAHWVWGGGFLGSGWLKALDFAGGTVVHINAGAAGLVACIMLGKRKGWPAEPMVPHNVPFVVLGAGILWFGWFGFNGGSALAAGGLASSAFVATHFGAASAMLGWIVPEYLQHKRVTTVGAATGAVAGLVAITPAAGFVRPWAAVVIGFVASFVCYYAVSMKHKLGYDDALDVVGVHFVGGIMGALLTGVFATLSVNSAGADGLVYGGGVAQLGRQALGVAVTIVWSIGVSFIILKIIDVTIGLRVSEEDEATGLDLSQHGEAGYTNIS